MKSLSTTALCLVLMAVFVGASGAVLFGAKTRLASGVVAGGVVAGGGAVGEASMQTSVPGPGARAGLNPALTPSIAATTPLQALALQQQAQPYRTRPRGRRGPSGVRSYGPLELPRMPQDANDAALPLRAPLLREGSVPYDFYFSRIAYSGTSMFNQFASWSVDFPKADRQFLLGVRRLIENLDLYPFENAVLLDGENLRDFPFLYAVEVGHMVLTEAETKGLREYLLAGGFLMVDDFWGTQEWAHFEHQMSQVLPGFVIEPLPLEHPIFHTFYDINRVVQVPNLGLARDVREGRSNRTWEKDGYVAEVKGIFDENRRLMVAINWNCDLGDAWEWAESSEYPLEFSTYAYRIGVNTIVYAMTH